MAVTTSVPNEIAGFLQTPTPEAWLDDACHRIPELLLDHANCELKAASTALGFLYRYPERTALAQLVTNLLDQVQCRGIGRQLLWAVMQALRELEFDEVRAVITEGNIPSEQLLGRAGFRRVDEA